MKRIKAAALLLALLLLASCGLELRPADASPIGAPTGTPAGTSEGSPTGTPAGTSEGSPTGMPAGTSEGSPTGTQPGEGASKEMEPTAPEGEAQPAQQPQGEQTPAAQQPQAEQTPAQQPQGEQTPAQQGEEQTQTPEPEQTPEKEPSVPVSTVSDGSVPLKPFGSYAYWIEDGVYKYASPPRNDSGRATMDEMYTFSRDLFPDHSEDNGWYFGNVTYNRETGEVTYHWAAPGSTADRNKATLDAFKAYGAIYRGDETKKCVYLTFDAGYEGGYTASILDTLRDKQAPATFFITGAYIRGEGGGSYSDQQIPLVGRMLSEGHIVGSHTNTHPNMTTKTVDEVIDEMTAVEKALKAAYPDSPDMIYFRPPEGACNEWLLRIEAKLGYRTVLWSCAHRDWVVNDQPDPAAALENIKNKLHPGCVYLLHVQSSTNAAILGDLIDYIRGEGYEILPLCSIE